MVRRSLPALILALAVALSTACQPVTKSPPAPQRVAIAGDSVTLTAMLYSGWTGWDYTDKVGLGWVARHAQPRVTRDVSGRTTSPDVLIMAFGHNYGRGWNTSTANEAMSLALSPHDTACTVLVLPYYAGTNTTHRTAINQYRAWATNLARAVPSRVITVDAAPVLTGNLASDGVHLNENDATTGRAFLTIAQDAIARCPT